MNPDFLTIEDVLEIHRVQLSRFGGSSGIRDQGLLESALAQPMTTFDGKFIHTDLFSMAAAYLFHVAKNHAFVDGNKRTALLAALVFLDVNGVAIDHSSESLYDLTKAIAEGQTGKGEAARILQQIADSKPST